MRAGEPGLMVASRARPMRPTTSSWSRRSRPMRPGAGQRAGSPAARV